ncbi:MAG: hypothetical protein JOZ42_09265 [Acetobacteraceae bacterium]|nr:hypothetical protein [Acetobacteraceae bacterium]
MPFIQAQLDGEGRVKAIIGAAGRKTLLGDQQWVDLFDGAGLPAALEPDMPLWLRSHAPLCVAFESVSVAAMRRGSGASWREALMLARGVHAAFGLLKALGYALHPSKRGLDRTPTWGVAAMLWSMSRNRGFRELLATGRAEADAIVSTMVAAAARASMPVRIEDIEAMKPF